jgi:conjugal transfer pilus assembly protein TrbC
MKALITAGLIGSAFTLTAPAQTKPSTPTASQLEAERVRVEQQRKELFSPTNPEVQPGKARTPTASELQAERERVEQQRKELFTPANPEVQSGKARTPTASQLQAERERVEQQRKEMFAPSNPDVKPNKAKVPSGVALELERQRIESERKAMFAADNPATKNAPNTFPNIPTPERSNIDIESLAKRYEGKAAARNTDGLMVFASFTMPVPTLKRLIADSTRAGGVVVLRGFKDGSLKNTAAAVSELGEAAGNVQINPEAFTKYRVKAVPAVVLIKPDGQELVDEDGCALPENYVMVAGDVGLGYALDDIARRSSAFGEMAARYGRPLKGSPR